MRSLLLVLVCLVLLLPNPLHAQDEDRPLYQLSYRIINVHRHCERPDLRAVRAELEVLDRVGGGAVVILDGGTTDGNLPAKGGQSLGSSPRASSSLFMLFRVSCGYSPGAG